MKEVRVCEAMKSPVGTLSEGTVLHQQDGGTKSRQVRVCGAMKAPVGLLSDGTVLHQQDGGTKSRQVRVCGAMKAPVGLLSDGTVLHQQDGGTKSRQVPIWEKSNLTLEEAAVYSGIGINKLREMSDSKDCTFVLWNGTKRLLKRRRLDEHLDRLFSI